MVLPRIQKPQIETPNKNNNVGQNKDSEMECKTDQNIEQNPPKPANKGTYIRKEDVPKSLKRPKMYQPKKWFAVAHVLFQCDSKSEFKKQMKLFPRGDKIRIIVGREKEIKTKSTMYF